MDHQQWLGIGIARKEGRDAPASSSDVLDLVCKGTSCGALEEGLEQQRFLDAAAHRELVLRECLDPRQSTLIHLEPSVGIGSDLDIGFVPVRLSDLAPAVLDDNVANATANLHAEARRDVGIIAPESLGKGFERPDYGAITHDEPAYGRTSTRSRISLTE
jgi:hypothetical protein